MSEEPTYQPEDTDIGEYETSSLPLVLLGTVLVGFVIYAASPWSLGMNIFERRATFLLLLVTYVLLRFPLVETVERDLDGKKRLLLYGVDVALVAMTLGSYGYLIVNSTAIMERTGIVVFPEPTLALVAIIVILEATRRTIGYVIPILVVVSTAYVFLGQLLPGLFSHPGFTFETFASQQYLTARGLFSFPLQVSLDYIYIFVFFGALLEVTGGGQAFLDIAKALVGRMRGGPAKLAVISSAFMGMLSGSTTANVLTTGSLTIPTMKNQGYDSEFAGAVESAASTGGQLTPPVMGIVVFVMIELTGLSYLYIITHAALPAVLFFLGIMTAVHFQSVKNGLEPIPAKYIPSKKTAAKKLWYFVPVVAIVGFLWMGYSVQRTILLSTVVLVVMTYVSDLVGLSDRARLYDPRIHDVGSSPILESIDLTAKRATPVIAAATAIGILIGNIGLTGIGIKISGMVARAGEGNLLLALVLAAALCILFGVTMTSINVYILVAVLVVPGLIDLGVGTFEAHMFVFYYGMLAMVTPPVCLAAYAASTIAESNPLETGKYASLLSAPAYLIPFSWVYSPDLLLIGPASSLFVSAATAVLGIAALSGGLIGFVTKKMGLLERAALIVGAVLLVHVSLATDAAGAALIVIGLWPQQAAIVNGFTRYQRVYRRKMNGLFKS